ncbi:MAG: hypothetical protein FJ034_07520, partial [Chloroflexi bacterium]|nr:hypothetical protein [Chloroflexota bacterium]
MSTRTAALVAAVLIVAGVALGALAARTLPRAAEVTGVASPSATPPIATGAPDTSALVFAQPLSAGCATDNAVWVVSDGGGIGRFADDGWSLAEPTLRSLVAAACARTELIAVGPGGRIVAADERSRRITTDMATAEDLLAVAALPAGNAVASGTRGTILLRDLGWGAYARGIEEDLLGVAYVGAESAWAVGASGAAYRLEARGWRALPTGLTMTLRGVSALTRDDAVAVGDDGALLRWR